MVRALAGWPKPPARIFSPSETTAASHRVKRLLSIGLHPAPLSVPYYLIIMVEKSRYENPPRWPRPPRVSFVNKSRRVVAAAMPYVLVTVIVCVLLAWYAHERLTH